MALINQGDFCEPVRYAGMGSCCRQARRLAFGTDNPKNFTRPERGAPQGAVISSLLANIYLHYVFDLWTQRWRQRTVTGDMIVTRYADDIVLGFQYDSEARRFRRDLAVRLEQFELNLHPQKTHLIRFGRFAQQQCRANGEGKPPTFDFLGFTHYCTVSRTNGRFMVGRKSIKKRVRSQLREIKRALRVRLHRPIGEDRGLAAAHAARAPELLRGSWQSAEPALFLSVCKTVLVSVAPASEPAPSNELATVQPAVAAIRASDPPGT